MRNLLSFAELLQGLARGNAFPERLKKVLQFPFCRQARAFTNRRNIKKRDAAYCHSRPAAMVVIARVPVLVTTDSLAATESPYFAACPAIFALVRQSFRRFSHAASASPALIAASAGL
jgi:hypothetical protein